MQAITMLLGEFAAHEAEHAVRPKFEAHTVINGQASGKCLSCNQYIGVKA